MSNSANPVRSITSDPAHNDDMEDGHTVTAPDPTPNISEVESVALEKFLIPTEESSLEAILDAERKDITPQVNDIIRRLISLQLRCGIKTRFHLIVERDLDDTVQRWIEQGSTTVSKCSRIETRVLISPTLKFKSEDTSNLCDSMSQALNAASFMSMKCAFALRISSDKPAPSARVAQSAPSPPGQHATEDPKDVDLLGFDNWDEFDIPEWFPFQDKMYKSGPQVSETELLAIPGDQARRFQRLSKDALEKIWSQFFRTLHEGVRRKSRKYRKLAFKYTLYTPPWLRKQIRIGTQIHQIGHVTILPVRRQRSDWGYKTMALILAGFFHNEFRFGHPVLSYLLNKTGRSSGRWGSARVRTRSDGTSILDRPWKIRLDDDGRPISPNRNSVDGSGAVRSATLPAPTSNSEQLPSASRAESVERRNSLQDVENETLGTVRNIQVANQSRNVVQRDSDEERHELGREMPPQPQAVSTTEPEERVYEINCAAGDQCRFKDDQDAQHLSGITAKCKECKRPVHDLCGGGEGDGKCCPGCEA